MRRADDTAFRSFSEVFGTTSASKFADVRLKSGDTVCIESCGGSGYGDPAERSKAMIARDIAEGFVSEEAAAETYGR
ncbi:MAG: hypothetical protein GY798_07580 [Hyphomicrobiales bacterium]|nr:hypothetical protein [Hyphomicrobiales bacterium]